MAAADHLHPQLFDTTPYQQPAPQRDYDPETWATQRDIVFHASREPQMPAEANVEGARPSQLTSYGVGFHVGELGPAMHRGRVTSPSWIQGEDFQSWNNRGYIHPLRMSGEVALRPEPNNPDPPKLYRNDSPEAVASNQKYYEAQKKRPMAFTDSEANRHSSDEAEFVRSGSIPAPRIGAEPYLRKGMHVPYVNAVEDTGSISYRSPREHLHTWAEDVQADPGASRQHKLISEQFDLTIPAHENMQTQLDRGVFKSGRGPAGLSGEVHTQPSLFGGEEKVSGESPLPILRSRMKRRGDPDRKAFG